jgi:hypothetical protein
LTRRWSPEEVISNLQADGEHTPSLLFPWWKKAALDAIARDHVFFIRGPDGSVYLARYWLTLPESDEDHYSSANSILLHQFLWGDDDRALHDHPTDFTSWILSGGYMEIMPGGKFEGCGYGGTPRGPHAHECIGIPRTAGDRISHRAFHMHRVADPLVDTWTLVHTGNRVRNWGFWPPGKAWVPWKQYVDNPLKEGP